MRSVGTSGRKLCSVKPTRGRPSRLPHTSRRLTCAVMTGSWSSNSGTQRVIGSSQAARPSPTSDATVAETKALEQEPMLKPVAAVTGAAWPTCFTPWAWW
jgi:hypothetical protein